MRFIQSIVFHTWLLCKAVCHPQGDALSIVLTSKLVPHPQLLTARGLYRIDVDLTPFDAKTKMPPHLALSRLVVDREAAAMAPVGAPPKETKS